MSPEPLPPCPDLSDEEMARLIVFPLPSVVFFPYTLLPLHIFEPRYRAMVDAALDSDRPIAVALLRPGYEPSYQKRPPVESIAGVGRIVHHEKLEGGRYNIILRGVGRVALGPELPPNEDFREFSASMIPDRIDDQALLEHNLNTLRGFIFSLGQLRPRLAALLSSRLGTLPEPGALADNLSALLLADQAERQRSLSEPCIEARLDTLNACLTHVLLDATPNQTIN